ncbi:hypothetical protein BWQ96_01479 [Gracilariopsis chorda]|uniref:Uncharacterized protein n=1 Tax=Gracilariopsis chorda TaxID=448386 RepID=A0A2V3J3R1_9FLOR|nr:hypothetical protein BWQ96_01479 [Gracilariopsis chorda]|eukprot:PXF48627.1 hypothetical protein BWQ96_01479 [Gracilariopsis chorda]
MTSLAFVSSVPLLSRSHSVSFFASHRGKQLSISHRHRKHPPTTTTQATPLRATPRASVFKDLLAGPSDPPKPRPLYQVILFTVTTNFLWYGWYKYCIEQELRALTGEGPGGVGALLPFVLGVTSPLYLPTGGPAEVGVAAGVLWIVSVQYYLYRRINALMVAKGNTPPLTPWWIVIPGFNLVVGLRSVHFLSLAFGAKRDADPVIDIFPFLGKETLGLWELVVTPSLWLQVGRRK